MPLTSVRGATTCEVNEAPAIKAATAELLEHLRQANPGLTPASALMAIFTTTPDLDAAFPAAAARGMGFTETALLGAVEAAVPGAPERCVRVAVVYESTPGGEPIAAQHGRSIYLRGAAVLRPDLAGSASAGLSGEQAAGSGRREGGHR